MLGAAGHMQPVGPLIWLERVLGKSNREGAITPEEGASAGSYQKDIRASSPAPPPNLNGRLARRAAFYSSSINSRIMSSDSTLLYAEPLGCL